MKILHLVRSLDIGNLAGGAEKFALILGLELSVKVEKQAFVVVYQTGSPAEAQCVKQLMDHGCEVVFLHTGYKFQFIRSLQKLGGLLRAYNPDIVQSHSQIAGLLTAINCRRSEFLFIRTAHTDREWGDRSLAWAARELVTRWIFPLVCDAQVAVSQSIFNRLQNTPAARWSRKPILLIPNALPMEYAAHLQEAKTRIYEPHLGMVVGTAGRLTRGKGFEDLLIAFQAARQEVPDVRLWIIGDGELRQPLENQAREMGISDGVTFWGQQQKMPELYRKMDLFVLPSLSEGLPTVMLESMACGTPVLASNIPGVVDLVEDGKTGWLVQPANPPALARTLVQHLTVDSEYIRIARTANRQAEKFLIAKIASEYLRLYRSLGRFDNIQPEQDD
jgi:glycosyltransferase involved in cell wall biosynthesis